MSKKLPPPLPRRIAEGFPGERLVVLPHKVVRHACGLPICGDIRVTHTGRFDRVGGHYVSRPKGCPQHVLIFCLDGRGTVQAGKAGWQMRRGHGVVLAPGTAHQYAASPRDPWSIFWFHFIGERAAACVRALGLPKARPGFWVQDVDMMVEAFEECYHHVLGGYTDADLIGLSTSFVRFLGLCRTLQRSPSTRLRRTEERIVRSVRFLRENLHRKLTLEQLAREAGISVPHFCAMFKRQINCGPLEFFARLKMQRACELLVRTEHGIAEIAYGLGFEDPLYFSKRFRQYMGVSPMNYRRA
ncbi:MAG: AraC family transcriptional regulator [Opitutaceae bacterium]|jgi:AraC-like DNA-binding protein|nr:AraC family transcriptional regulator [Opitutaceae bacterium]